MIIYVVFDLGEVLVKVDPQPFFIRFAEEFNVSLLELTQNQNDGAHRDFMMGKLTAQEFHQKTCQHFNHFIPIDKLKDIWTSMLIGEVEGMTEIVNRLYAQHYGLALLSNTDPWHYEYCERILPALQKFEKKFLSYNLQLKKPDPAIFLTVAHELNVAPEECVLIDDLLENVIAARNVNYSGIHFKNADQLKQELRNLGVKL